MRGSVDCKFVLRGRIDDLLRGVAMVCYHRWIGFALFSPSSRSVGPLMFSLEPQIVALALKSARLVTWEWDATADELRWTSGQSEIYSWPVAEINSSLAWSELVHADDRERLQRAVGHALETESEFHEQFRIAGKDGRVIWILGYG